MGTLLSPLPPPDSTSDGAAEVPAPRKLLRQLVFPSSLLFMPRPGERTREGSQAGDRDGTQGAPWRTRARHGNTHVNGIPLKDAQLQEELELDLALLEELLHLGLGLVQLLQHRLDVADGAVVWGLVAGDGRVPAREQSRERGFHRDRQKLEEQVSAPDTRSGGWGWGGGGGKKASRKRDCWSQKMERAALPQNNSGFLL